MTMAKRAQTIQQKQEILDRILAAWDQPQHREKRLGQLLMQCIGRTQFITDGDGAVFDDGAMQMLLVEDYDLIERVEHPWWEKEKTGEQDSTRQV